MACVGEDEATFVRRAQALGREPDELRANAITGTVQEAAAKMATFETSGITRAYLQVLDLHDLDHLHTLSNLR